MRTNARATPRFFASAQNDPAAKRQPRVSASGLLIYAVLVLAALVFFLPFYWMIVSSFRPTAQFFQLPIPLFPNPPSLENFETLFARTQFVRGMAQQRLPGHRRRDLAGLVLRPGRLHLRQAALQGPRARSSSASWPP